MPKITTTKTNIKSTLSKSSASVKSMSAKSEVKKKDSKSKKAPIQSRCDVSIKSAPVKSGSKSCIKSSAVKLSALKSSAKSLSQLSSMSKSKVGATSTFSGVQSQSKIGASMMKSSIKKGSLQASSVGGRPVEQISAMRRLFNSEGAMKLDSKDELKKRGFEVKEKYNDDPNMFQAHVSHAKHETIVKIISLKNCTPRYKITLEKHSLKICRFIGAKPMTKVCPKVLEIFLIKDNYYIFMHEFSFYTLYDVVIKGIIIPVKQIQNWIKQLTETVVELQKNGIAHRFLKLKHLLHNRVDNTICVCGWSKAVFFFDPVKNKQLQQHRERKARKNNFLPPEAFHQIYDPSKADSWSLGVILVALTTHRYPFHVRNKTKFTKQWREFVKKHAMNPIVRSVCNKFFVVDPAKRIRPSLLINEPYFTVNPKQLINKACRGEQLSSKIASKKSKSEASISSNKKSTSVKSKHSKKKKHSKAKFDEYNSSGVSASQIGKSRPSTVSKVSNKSASSISVPSKVIIKKSKPSKKKTGKGKHQKHHKNKKSKQMSSKKKSKAKSVAKQPGEEIPAEEGAIEEEAGVDGGEWEGELEGAENEINMEGGEEALNFGEGMDPAIAEGDGLMEAPMEVSQAEEQAEMDDAAAEQQQIMEEAQEPEMNNVPAEEAAAMEGAEGMEGQNDDMGAPEEAAEAAEAVEGEPVAEEWGEAEINQAKQMKQ